MRRQGLASLCLVGLCALACGACTKSGSGAGSAAATGATTKADFTQRAQVICKAMSAKATALSPPPSGFAGLSTYLSGAVNNTKDGLAQLKALPEPPGDQATLSALWAAMQAVVDSGTLEVADLKAGNQSAAQTQDNTTTSDSAALNRAFQDYGLSTCASG